MWNAIKVTGGDLYAWDDKSTYIQEPPFLEGITREVSPILPILGARCLALLGDSVTTDHISPAGNIPKESPAGKHLIENGVKPVDFNSYGARRGNDRVMVRGTFANIRLRNFLAPGTEGGVTKYWGANFLPVSITPLTSDTKAATAATSSINEAVGQVMPIFDAAMLYKAANVPTIVLAGAEYGTGSSRDWAAKGTSLLGIRAVIAQSFERIHRSNLVNMGVLPLQFLPGETWKTLALTGEEIYEIIGLNNSLQPRSVLTVQAISADGFAKQFQAIVRIDTPVEMDYYRNGGILQTVLRKLLG
jgi:aconitate hydratase